LAARFDASGASSFRMPHALIPALDHGYNATALSYFVAYFAYALISGRDPDEFSAPRKKGQDSDSVRPIAKNRLSLALAAPGIAPELAQAVDGALESPTEESLTALERALRACAERPAAPPLAEASLAEATQRRDKRIVELRRRGALILFWRKTRVAFAAAAVVAITVLLMSLPKIKDTQAREARFAAMSPIEVVNTLYHSVDTLDADNVEACFSKKSASKADSEMVSSIYVLSRYRTANESKSPLMSPAQWLSMGAPDIGPGVLFFGITDLSVSQVFLDGKLAEYRTSYRRWLPPDEDKNLPVVESITDNMRLKKTGRGWKIYSLNRTGASIPARTAVADLQAAASGGQSAAIGEQATANPSPQPQP
jgi:hypothetical protein